MSLLTNETLTQYKELRARLKEIDEEHEEYDGVLSRIREIVTRAWRSLACCSESLAYPVVIGEVVEGRWRWFLDSGSRAYQAWLFDHLNDLQYSRAPAPKFCPFCATPLPDMVFDESLLPNVPVYRMNERFDGYCATCDQRNHNCLCLPETVRWRSKG